MRIKRDLFAGFFLWLCSPASTVAQFPYLNVYLNTPNCYAHSRGILALENVDQRCAKGIVISEKGHAMMGELLTSLGLPPNSVALHTVPSDQFNAALWQRAFSRFVFGIGKDTIYDTNLDFLFQYTDSINQQIADADALEMALLDPPIATSGNIGSTALSDGKVILLDTYLDRITQCTIRPGSRRIGTTTLQLPEALGNGMSSTLKTSNLFTKPIHYEEICPTTPSDGALRLFGTTQNVGSDGDMYLDHVLFTIPPSGGMMVTAIKAQKGFSASARNGALVNDTLYTEIHRSDAEESEIHFGAFVLAHGLFVQIEQPEHAQQFPPWINEKLRGNYCDGTFVGSTYFFKSMPLIHHVASGTYRDIGTLLGMPLDTVVTNLSRNKFGTYYCSEAIVNGTTATLLYWQRRVLHHATIDLVAGKLLKSGVLPIPNGWSIAIALIDRDHALFISDDQLHAWLIPLE
ncbi:MAG: hypothetical protein IT226_12505 [Flavobacteriales bacterium]|nr:hypothetical protein [Flavobacteriales bacterium]